MAQPHLELVEVARGVRTVRLELDARYGRAEI